MTDAVRRLVDTHCHLDFERYDADRAEVVARAAAVGVTRIINPGVDLATCRSALTLTAQVPQLYLGVGVHPNSTADFTPSMLDDLRGMVAASDRVLAIGEIGLDYHWDRSPKTAQFAAFEAQLALAAELELPVIIHNREASEDVMAILEAWAATLPESLKARPGVLHSFSAPAAIAERALTAGFYLGFTGPITYKNAEDLRRIASTVPLDRMVVETDGPFLTPSPHRRDARNEPAYIPLMVERLAGLKQLPVAEMAQATTANAERLFALPSEVSR